MANTTGGVSAISKRLLLSYVFDWIVIIAAVGVGAAFSSITPNMRPFSPVDQTISFPFVQHEKITNAVLLIISVVVPAVIIFLVCLFFVPGPTVDRQTPRSLIWRRKFWEWNTGWLGLGLALATAFLITDGMKNLFGKPRPDLLSRCDPDLAHIRNYAVGGYGNQLDEGILLVSHLICKNQALLKDGFRSFPSGHASSSWAGMTYLTLFLCSKFAIAIPFLAPRAFNRNTATAAFPQPSRRGLHPSEGSSGSYPKGPLPGHADGAGLDPDFDYSEIPLRNQAAAPPTYLLVIALIPLGVAIYISSTRYSDFRHQGFDILFGSILGFAAAWFAFRWYHLPIRQGAGWSWGARSRERAFGVGVGVNGYVGYEGWSSGHTADRRANGDMELGPVEGSAVTGAGRRDAHSATSNALTAPQLEYSQQTSGLAGQRYEG